jgi:hypothetical protein
MKDSRRFRKERERILKEAFDVRTETNTSMFAQEQPRPVMREAEASTPKSRREVLLNPKKESSFQRRYAPGHVNPAVTGRAHSLFFTRKATTASFRMF